MDEIRAQAHNSRLPINTVIPDILYRVFVLAIYDTKIPVQSALRISHVCSHWRRSALGWPSLWAFVDLSATSSMIDLFISRSGQAPLTLTWMEQARSWPIPADVDNCTPKLYLESKANLIVPRLCSLTLHLFDHQFASLITIFQSSHSLPLQMRCLDILLYPSTEPVKFPLLTNYLRVDLSCLRKLRIKRLDPPWLGLTGSKLDKLTQFKLLHLNNPPSLSQFLRFLSTCPLLCELEIFIADGNSAGIDVSVIETKTPRKIELPNVKHLFLGSDDLSGYVYIQKLSTRIRPAKNMSRFYLMYDNINDSNLEIATLSHFHIFEAIPSGVLSQVTGHNFLHISIDSELGNFRVFFAHNRFCFGSDVAFDVFGTFPPSISALDYSTPILDLVHANPETTELELGSQAWKLPWITDVDMSSLFPSLRTLILRFWGRDVMTPVLNFLPSADLKLERLVLVHAYVVSPAALLDTVLKTGIEFVELCGDYDDNMKATLKDACTGFICWESGTMEFRFSPSLRKDCGHSKQRIHCSVYI